MTYINRNYFLSQYEDPNTIWQYLSCPEKIAYFQINSKIPFIEGVFSDDINICLKERETLLFLDRASFSSFLLLKLRT